MAQYSDDHLDSLDEESRSFPDFLKELYQPEEFSEARERMFKSFMPKKEGKEE